MRYPYYLIALVVLLFIIIIFYLPANEGFDSNQILLARKLKLFVERVGDKLVASTFSNVILPCVRTSQYKTYPAIVKCIASYTRFYEDVLHEPIYELYENLKGKTYYNDYPFDPLFNIDLTDDDVPDDTPPVDEHVFIMTLFKAYGKALSSTLDQIKININRPENIIMVSDSIMNDRDMFRFTFKPIFTSYLIESITEALTTIYTK